MKSHVSSSPHAFTLVEVLVSLAIFSLAAVTLSSAYLNVISGYRDSETQRERHENWSLVRLLVLIEPDREEIEKGGQITLPDNTTLRWRAGIEPTELADLFALELHGEIAGKEGWTQNERLMLFRPEWSDPGERDQLRETNRQRFEQTRPL